MYEDLCLGSLIFSSVRQVPLAGEALSPTSQLSTWSLSNFEEGIRWGEAWPKWGLQSQGKDGSGLILVSRPAFRRECIMALPEGVLRLC